MRLSRTSWLLLLAVYALSLLFCWYYVSGERWFYAADNRGYQDRTFELLQAFTASPLTGLVSIFKSLDQDYNKLPSLPLLPILAVFGTTRVAYVAALTAVYVVPLALALGAVATRLVGGPRPLWVFWSGAIVALLLPPTWTAALRGLPDAGGGLLIALALYLYLGDPGFRRLRTAVLAGCCLGAAVLFRRHFGYVAAAVLLAMACDGFAQATQALDRWRDELLQSLKGLGATALIAVVIVFAVAPEFAWRAASTDYSTLYDSWRASPSTVFLNFVAGYGAVVASLALAGAVLGTATGVMACRPGRVLLLYGAWFVAIWLAVPRQYNVHQTYGATLFVALGLTVLLWTVALRLGAAGRVSAPLLMGLLIVNAVQGAGLLPRHASLGGLLARPFPPLVRSDYAVVEALIASLDELPPSSRVFVAAASDVLNADLVRGIVEIGRPGDTDHPVVLRSPGVDSRDGYPINALTSADYVVVASPPQTFMRPGQQDVVRTVVEQFQHGWGAATDFAPLPGEFVLGDGVVVRLYQRRRTPALVDLLRGTEATRADVGEAPGGEAYWLALNPTRTATVSRDDPSRPRLEADLADGPAMFIYFGAAAGNPVFLGKLDAADCGAFRGLMVEVQPIDADGRGLAPAETREMAAGTGQLPLRLQSASGPYIAVRLAGSQPEAAAQGCPIVIQGAHFGD